MKVWVIGEGIPTKRYPLYATFPYNQAKNLAIAEKDLEITYIGLDFRSIRRVRPFRVYRKQDNMNVFCWSFPVGAISQRVRYKFFSWQTRKALKKCLKKYGKPEIIHTHFSWIGYSVATNMDLLSGVKFIHTEHWSKVIQEPIDPYVFKTSKLLYEKANKIISVSPSLQNIIRTKFNIDSVYIPNMIDDSIFYTEDNISSLNNLDKEKEFTFIGVGSLVSGKNFKGLLGAFFNVFSSNDAVKLIIIGDGVERPILESMIQNENRENQVFLVGVKSSNEVANFLRQSDCFVLPSKYETFGVVYAEAAMCGIPCIATKCGGPECIINKDNGILIEKDSDDELSRALIYMHENILNYNKQKISLDATSKFGKKNVITQIHNIYNDFCIL